MMKTSCPQCKTVLTLNQQQVDQRNGMVRCGVCRQVFNALEHLYEEEDYPVLSEDEGFSEFAEHEKTIYPNTSTTTRRVDESPERPHIHIHVNPSPVSATQTINSSERHEPRITIADQLDGEEDYYISHPRASSIHMDARDDFRVQGDDAYDDHYVPRRSSSGGLFWFVLILIALLLVVGQVFYVFRNQISAAFPSTRPFLTQICGVFKCEVGIQKSIDNLALENVLISVDKTKLPKRGEHALLLQAVLVNKVDHAQDWPMLILRLKNAEGVVMNSKNIQAKEYLAAEQALRPFTGQSRQAIYLPFVLVGEAISSYELSLFYP